MTARKGGVGDMLEVRNKGLKFVENLKILVGKGYSLLKETVECNRFKYHRPLRVDIGCLQELPEITYYDNSCIEPPPEFQDHPPPPLYQNLADRMILNIIDEGIRTYCDVIFKNDDCRTSPGCWTTNLLPYSSPPPSKLSMVSARLCTSNTSLAYPTRQNVDDSSFITQAVSHDNLVSNEIIDIYNVPFDSDLYAVPVDMVRPQGAARRGQQHRKRRRNTSSCCHEFSTKNKQAYQCSTSSKRCYGDCGDRESRRGLNKRHSVACSSAHISDEPIHMTLQEVRQYFETLYSSSSESYAYRECAIKKDKKCYDDNQAKNSSIIELKNKKNACDITDKEKMRKTGATKPKKLFSLKQTLCNLFKFRRYLSGACERRGSEDSEEYDEKFIFVDKGLQRKNTDRALPPLPSDKNDGSEEQSSDFATNIQKVKDYGWYWGPLSSEAAEKILSNEPDGTFIVRDSSDDHYIFSLTFKLNNSVRHVRIEHDQGNFTFGSCTNFKSQTIVEFIENAVEHSRSGRYLFFLHRRPVIGPVRVQLLHPLSRFKQVQSLQHMCRFVILKYVRRDRIPSLQLPRRIIDYLSTPHYYSENFPSITEEDER